MDKAYVYLLNYKTPSIHHQAGDDEGRIADLTEKSVRRTEIASPEFGGKTDVVAARATQMSLKQDIKLVKIVPPTLIVPNTP